MKITISEYLYILLLVIVKLFMLVNILEELRIKSGKLLQRKRLCNIIINKKS